MTQSTNLKLDLLSATDLFDTDKIKSNFEKIDNTVLIPTKIIDNCVTDNSLLPLSAKQGKLLQDQITKLNGDLQWKLLDTFFVNGWVNNGNSYYMKVGNGYLIKMSARYGTCTPGVAICENLPFSGQGICLNCFYDFPSVGSGIQMQGSSIVLIGRQDGMTDNIFASFFVCP